jgi:hypothetical protein
MLHEIPDHKICPHCDTDKPASEYHRNAARKDGLTYVCADCIPAYEAKDKRPKRNLESIQKECEACLRLLPSRMFQYAQHTEDHLRSKCRTCSAYKLKKVPSQDEINRYELSLAKILNKAKEKYDLDSNRSELEQFVWKEMLKVGLLNEWNIPTWLHKTSIPE